MRRLKTALVVGSAALIGSFAHAAGEPLSCLSLFSDRAESVVMPLSPESLWAVLDEKTVNGTEIIQHLSQDPQFQRLFKSSAGVQEGYSIEIHTLRVFAVFTEQYGPYLAHYQLQPLRDVRLFQTLKFAIALHDIGKPSAIEAGDKNRQHAFTIPILDQALSRFGFSLEEFNLAHALVGNDILGDLVKGNIDTSMAKVQLARLAATAGLSLAEFLPLQFLFYVSDAGSYPALRRKIFVKNPDGLLIPNGAEFERLWDLVSKP